MRGRPGAPCHPRRQDPRRWTHRGPSTAGSAADPPRRL